MNDKSHRDEVAKAKYSDALEEDFEKYKNIVYALMLKYTLRGYDKDDWLQEAREVCWKSREHYDSFYGRSFGAYFKLNFERRVISIIRSQSSSKRSNGLKDASLEEVWEKYGDFGTYQSGWRSVNESDEVELRALLADLPEYLSRFELAVWLSILCGKSVVDVCQLLTVTVPQVVNAIDRIKRKIRVALK